VRLEFNFVVGEVERHSIEFSYKQLLGRLIIKVDGRRLIRDWRDILPFSYTKEYPLAVGERERPYVVIRKTKQRLPYGGSRPQTVTVFIDGRQISEHRTR